MPVDLCTFCRKPITAVPCFDEASNAYCSGDCWLMAKDRAAAKILDAGWMPKTGPIPDQA